MSDLTPAGSTELIDPQAQRILEIVEAMGLPVDNILADLGQRQVIGKNIQSIIEEVPADARSDARYLSKFVLGAGFGLFDYSLNAIWNEVVINLRRKAVLFGLDIFYDAAVGGSRNRDSYETEEDLVGIKDSALLSACHKLELISDTTYKKLAHILDMRNDVGISHPTSYSINAYELLGWLQTCVADVLQDQPTAAALQVQAFVKNLKDRTDPIDQQTVRQIEESISALPRHLCGSMLRTVFGVYCATETDPAVRKNISEISPILWANCLDEPKYKLGIVLQGYKLNLHKDKYDLGQQFFSVVGGNAFRSESERSIIVDDLVDQLWEMHCGWDNFANEAPVARSLASYIGSQKDILNNFSSKMFKVVLACRIGRGVSYNNGVSPSGKKHYDHILSLAGDQFAGNVLSALSSVELNRKLANPIARQQTKLALEQVSVNVINARLKECLSYVISHIEADSGCMNSKEFKDMASAYLGWTD
jgi:hypothetical protein